MFYADGGPGPATKLYRVDAPDGCSESEWQLAQGYRWVVGGWYEEHQAQLFIRQSGELFLVDESEVPKIQAQLREKRAAWFNS